MSTYSNAAVRHAPVPLRVLVIDDSLVVQKLLAAILDGDPDYELVGVAADADEARAKIKALNPDVATLDVHMPGMDGLVFLRNLMRLRPMPVIMCSSWVVEGRPEAIEALELGALACVPKPDLAGTDGVKAFGERLLKALETAASARGFHEVSRRAETSRKPRPRNPIKPRSVGLIAIGASTGGVETLRNMLRELGGDLPPIIITQHILDCFSGAFIRRLDEISALTVVVAEEGQVLKRGHVYVAQGSAHLAVVSEDLELTITKTEEPPVNGHRPSVDVMFSSVARAAGSEALGILLTGMGRDGAGGLKTILDNGGQTLIQSEESCVIWGMPAAAKEIGAARVELDPEAIVAAIATCEGNDGS